MRSWGIVVALALAGCTSSAAVCDPKAFCSGAAGAWTQFCNHGSGGCYYQTSDGSRFQCASCGDCTAARQFATAWCTSPPGGDLGSTGETCSQAVTCPTGNASGTYQLCTDSTGTQCRYKTSDGSSFACAACTNCTAAATQLSAWCQGGPAPDLAVSSTPDLAGALDCSTLTNPQCYECCYNEHPEGFTKIQPLHSCECPLCSACTGSIICSGPAMFSMTCSSCFGPLQSSGAACGTQAQACRNDPDCVAITTCTQKCPPPI